MTGRSAGSAPTRLERDFLGELPVPAEALYGVHTARALDNFPSSGRCLGDEPALVGAFAALKRAAAAANARLGVLEAAQAELIIAAADEIAKGRHREHFVVDLLEGAGGTSLNMNVNEVLANRGLQLAGHAPGEYAWLHPNDHVNRSQSTNDVVPAAILVASHAELGRLIDELAGLATAIEAKAVEFAALPRLGRTCLQDAQPMLLGQAFGGYAAVVERSARMLEARRGACLELPLGATAIGTGFGAPDGYRAAVLAALAEATGVPWHGIANLFDGLGNADGYARLSGELRNVAVSLAKIANDLMLLASGPHGGIAELRLPAVQAGSSIMPGKVNPVIPLSVCQVGFAVTGNDVAIASACQQGQLEINPYEPLIAARLFDSFRLVRNAAWQLRERCVAGIEADAARMREHLLRSSAVATALVPRLGYAAVSDWVRRSEREGVPFLHLLESQGVLTREEALAVLQDCAGPART